MTLDRALVGFHHACLPSETVILLADTPKVGDSAFVLAKWFLLGTVICDYIQQGRTFSRLKHNVNR